MELLRRNIINELKSSLRSRSNKKIRKHKFIKYIYRVMKKIFMLFMTFSFKILIILKHKIKKDFVFSLDENEVYDWSKLNKNIMNFYNSIDKNKPIFIQKLDIKDNIIYLEYLMNKKIRNKKIVKENISTYKELFLDLKNKEEILTLKNMLINEVNLFEK